MRQHIYRHDLLFGTFITPAAGQPDQVVRLAQLTEQVGLDLVSIQDHPYQPKFLDTWTLLSVIAARTSRVRVFPNVANLPLRPPAVLARSVASLDSLSAGRVELGLGAGAFWPAVRGMGGPSRRPGEAVDALDEAIQVIRALWTPGPGVKFDGRHYQLHGAKPGPFPVHDIGIWVGGYKPRMLRLIGRAADGWLPSSPYAPPEQLSSMNRIIDEAARRAGRDPAAIRRLYNVTGDLSAERLAELAVTEGISGFVMMGDSAADIRRFAGEIVPAVRELVASGQRPAAVSLPTPTPYDGKTQLWDEATRPSGPAPEPGRVYAPHEQARARELVDVHNHLRAELTQLRDLVDQVTAGALDPGVARSTINTMTMRQNSWTVGSYCESYCRLVTLHHSLEDGVLFPHLRRDARLAPVLDRLQEEHEAIHGVIEAIDRALVAFVANPAAATELRAAVDLLTDGLLSHLSYEERELIEPLARL